jgi:uncharacterized protein
VIDPSLPGAPPFPPDLAPRLAAAYAAKGPGYAPRTHHLDGGRPRFTNRLILETSPYLLQHAHNPVSWWAWGDEAFDAARREGKPVFLSIGYSTCHWCHVMERESFEDVEVAAFLNEHFIPIKVDREERPDVDAIYMTAVQALTGSGGWPMSVFLDGERQPFFGGTYFPARDGDRGAPRGFLTLLHEIAAVWQRDPPRVRSAAASLADAVKTALGSAPEGTAPDLPGPECIEKAVRFFESAFDPVHGGVNRAPKFPSNIPVRLLLRHHRRTRDPAALSMAVFTLERMAAGGLMDQVGGGFHRYSTDAAWLVPHFEKMLYDNALLALAYAEAWQATRRPNLKRVTHQTLDYALREMATPDGAFYSATDADSEGEEGWFFTWEARELREVLGPEYDRFAEHYGVTERGNFEGRNILWVKEPDEDAWRSLTAARAKLYAVREKRVHPLRDAKVVASWNGLMISALAVAGRIFPEPLYVDAAARAARFVLGSMRPGGRLARTFMDGACGPRGFLDDHAFLTQALLDLHEATFDPAWLEAALALADETERRFADPRGGWFVAGDDAERLIAREKPTHDGAEPSGASIALLDALRLEAFTGDDRWRRVAEGALRWYAPTLTDQPVALTEMLCAVEARDEGMRELVVVWPEAGPLPAAMLEATRRLYAPNVVLTGAPEGAALARLARVAPVAAGRVAQRGQATAYLCERGACQLPATTPEALLESVRAAPGYR